jgi:hypothetical protein
MYMYVCMYVCMYVRGGSGACTATYVIYCASCTPNVTVAARFQVRKLHSSYITRTICGNVNGFV